MTRQKRPAKAPPPKRRRRASKYDQLPLPIEGATPEDIARAIMNSPPRTARETQKG